MKKTAKKVIFTLCTAVILSALAFTGFKYFFPKAHSGSETTTEYTASATITAEKTETKSKSTTVAATVTKPTTTSANTVTKKVTTTCAASLTQVKKTEKTSFTLNIKPIIPRPTAATTLPQSTSTAQTDLSKLDNCAFIGNSRVIALKNYGLAKNVYAVVGLNVDTIFTKSVAGSNIPVIDELNGKSFEKIFIMLGDNECGWPNKDVFIQKYAKVIDAVKARVPDAEIYLQSVLPVSKEASETNQFGCTNENINAMNLKIRQLAADKGVQYIEPASALKNTDGVLPTDAASDGIHLNKKYCKIWLTFLIEHIEWREN